MGLRPVSDPMSYNEIQWWSAFRGVCPLTSEMMDINVQALTGQSMQWFNPMNDADHAEEEALKLREINKEAREKLKRERELKNGN